MNNLESLKEKIITTIEASQDETLLEDVMNLLSHNTLSEDEVYYKNRLKSSIQQAEEGKLKGSEEVHQLARKWITK